MKVKTITTERVLVEGTTALIKRPDYTHAARFISLPDGKGDMVAERRKKRESEGIGEVVRRIRSKIGS